MDRVNDWTNRYEIVSVRGRLWTRAMVRKGVMAHLSDLRPIPAIVDEVLNDHTFMRFMRGMVPSRVIEAVWLEARLRAEL